MEPPPKPTVLLIDDDPSILMSVGDQLRFHGYEVVSAESAEQALEQLDRVAPDLIVLDISMPGMGGVAFLKQIAGNRGMRYPVLVFTARAELDQFFAHTGIDGFLSKMSDPEMLLREVNHIVGKYRAASSGTGGQPRIVLAENDVQERRHLTRFFQRQGFDVAEAATGYEAITLATARRPALMLLNYLLPQINGPAVAAMLGSMPSTQGVPIIVYDGSGVADHNARYANVFLFVPSAKDDVLLKVVLQFLGRSESVSTAVK